MEELVGQHHTRVDLDGTLEIIHSNLLLSPLQKQVERDGDTSTEV